MNLSKEEQAIIKRLEKLAVHNDPIDQSLYSKYDVKRGLRDANGKGILTGLTEISDVIGFDTAEDGTRTPVEGQLYYQGYNVRELTAGSAGSRFGFEETISPAVMIPLISAEGKRNLKVGEWIAEEARLPRRTASAGRARRS